MLSVTEEFGRGCDFGQFHTCISQRSLGYGPEYCRPDGIDLRMLGPQQPVVMSVE
jgi:hypothetical protein